MGEVFNKIWDKRTWGIQKSWALYRDSSTRITIRMLSKPLFHIRIVFPFVTHLLILTIVLTRKGYKIHSSLTAPGCAYILDYFPRIHSHDLGILFMSKEVDYGSDYCPRQRV